MESILGKVKSPLFLHDAALKMYKYSHSLPVLLFQHLYCKKNVDA